MHRSSTRPRPTSAAATSRAVILAPYHADSDTRVRRTIPVLADAYGQVDVFWDAQYVGHRFSGESDVNRVREHHVKRKLGRAFLSMIGARSLAAPIIDAIKQADLTYIHASGIEGLLLAREVRRYRPDCSVVFDYHDSLSYELFYQLRKRKLGWLFKPAWRFYRLGLRRCARAVNGVVGISRNQIFDLEEIAARSIPSAIVPNLRPFGRQTNHPRSGSANERVAFVWLGQVMRGRDLERLAQWTLEIESGFSLHIFGQVLDQDVETEVKRVLGARAVFHGTYAGDDDIVATLPPRSVGVFLGWDDPCDTGINRIASPNKYFTYVNLELPVILDRRLEGLASELANWHAGIAVGDSREFAQAADRMEQDYDTYQVGMARLKTSYRELVPETSLNDLLSSIANSA